MLTAQLSSQKDTAIDITYLASKAASKEDMHHNMDVLPPSFLL